MSFFFIFNSLFLCSCSCSWNTIVAMKTCVSISRVRLRRTKKVLGLVALIGFAAWK
ncbi:hypothetical protein E1A91_D05G160700v1 [Gossypium mustelinum]|uniref:Uncharacterized protein n=1 Tax=Gossypium mustelinum TaxID=34275 RepID=A0A5D2UXR7_GOSMU|nr:hypothetical protein E1A91_D05G160700v1 [Gossypium mustelinum]